MPPLNSIVKSTNKKIGLRYGISFLDKGYAQSEEKKTEIGTHIITRKTLFSKPKKRFSFEKTALYAVKSKDFGNRKRPPCEACTSELKLRKRQ